MLGLQWLLKHQNPDGSWGHSETEPDSRIAASSYGLLALLYAGYTTKDSRFGDLPAGECAARARLFLQRRGEAVAADPAITPSEPLALAALALIEGYAISKDPEFRRSAESAIRVLRSAKECGDAETDAALGLTLLALHSAWRAELDGGRSGVEESRRRLRSAAERNRACDSAKAMLFVVAGGEDVDPTTNWDSLFVALGDAHEAPPEMMFWGSLALFAVEGPAGTRWQSWYPRAMESARTAQVGDPDDDRFGSWSGRGRCDLCSRAIPAANRDVRTEILELVSKLGHEDWMERERGMEELRKIGRPALFDLLAARASPDPEVCDRATKLAAEIVRCPHTRVETTALRVLALEVCYRYGNIPAARWRAAQSGE